VRNVTGEGKSNLSRPNKISSETEMQSNDHRSKLWGEGTDTFFREVEFKSRRQSGPHCVATVLSMLTDKNPEDIRPKINTQDPVRWSSYLMGHGMKLAFCPSDCRQLRHYLDDLLEINDLFTLSYYSPAEPEKIFAEPNDSGWILTVA